MRHLIIATGILVIAAHATAQSTTKAAPPAPVADTTVPPLMKTVADDPNDSPMVRAAKKAVASRVNAGQRRVVTLATTTSRGRFAESSGASSGPTVVPLSPPGWATPVQRPQPSASEREAAQKAEAVRQEKLKKLQAEQGAMGAEMDEPYGHEVDEDEAEQRLAKAAAEQQKLEQSAPKPPR